MSDVPLGTAIGGIWDGPNSCQRWSPGASLVIVEAEAEMRPVVPLPLVVGRAVLEFSGVPTWQASERGLNSTRQWCLGPLPPLERAGFGPVPSVTTGRWMGGFDWCPDSLGSTSMSNEQSIELVIPNRLGLHLRAAKAFAVAAMGFQSEIVVTSASHSVNGKSILELTTLAAAKGTRIKILARGDDASSAIESLGTLVRDGFGEE